MSWWEKAAGQGPDIRVGRLLVASTKQRVAAEYQSMLAGCEAAGWKAGWHRLDEQLDVMVAAMDAAVAQDDLEPIKRALADYRKPVRITWTF